MAVAVTTKDAKRRNGFILMIVAGVLVLAVAGAGVFLLTGGSSDDPDEVATEFVELYQRGLNSSGRDVDPGEFEPVVCAENMAGIREVFAATEKPVDGMPKFALSIKDVKTDGDKGTFTVVSEITVPGTEKQSADETFGLVEQDGSWRVCGLG